MILAMGLLLVSGGACKKDKAKSKPKEDPAKAEPAAKTTETAEAKPAEPEAPASPDSDVEMVMLNQSEVKWVDAPMFPKGAQISVLEGTPPFAEQKTFAVLAKFPKGYVLPPHVHPGIERVTVISGEFNLGHGEKVDKKVAKKITAGGIFMIPPGHAHFAFMGGKDTTVMLAGVGPWGIHYIDPKNDPRQPPPPKVEATEHPFDTVPPDMVILDAAAIKYVPAPPGTFPATAEVAFLEGDPAQARSLTGRLKVPKGYMMPVHTHPATERVLIISGTVKFGHGDTFDEKSAKDLQAGGIAILPKDHKHSFMATSDTVMQAYGIGPFKIVWANPADDPASATAAPDAETK